MEVGRVQLRLAGDDATALTWLDEGLEVDRLHFEGIAASKLVPMARLLDHLDDFDRDELAERLAR